MPRAALHARLRIAVRVLGPIDRVDVPYSQTLAPEFEHADPALEVPWHGAHTRDVGLVEV